MNDTERKQYDDEIDLFEILEIIWQGKWIIVASVFIVLAAAYAYVMSKEFVYEYNISYSSKIAPDAEEFNHLLTLSDLPFSLNTKSKTLSLISTNPNYEALVSSEVAIIGNKLVQSLIDEANDTIKDIEDKSQLIIDQANYTIKDIEDKSQRIIDEKIDEAEYTIKEIEYRSQLLIERANHTVKLMKEDFPVQILNSDSVANSYLHAITLIQLSNEAGDTPSYLYHSDAAAQSYFKAKSVLQNITDGAEDNPIYIHHSDAAKKLYFEAKTVLQKVTDGAEDAPIYLDHSDAAKKLYFEAKSVLQNITDGANTIKFRPVVKTVKSPTVWLFPVLPVIMGGVVGLLFIFLLRIIVTYKKRQQTAI